MARNLEALAGQYRALGRATEAWPFYQRALSIKEELLGSEHSEVDMAFALLAVYYFTDLNTLGVLFLAQNQYAEAEPFFRGALSMREKTLGPEHADVGDTLASLAVACGNQERWLEAEIHLRRAVAIREKVLGPAHPNVVTLLDADADLLRRLDRNVEADELEERIKTIKAKP